MKLLEYNSETNREIVKIFNVLDSRGNIHVTLGEDSEVEVFLPHFELRFFLADTGQLFCKQLNLEVDNDQSIRTLIGLENKLVLRAAGCESLKTQRQVLIPFGQPNFQRQKAGHQISIAMPDSIPCQYFCYKIDETLQKLSGPLDPKNELFLIYLHALTSSGLPDPFTDRSGAEEALSRLQAGSLFSCISCNADDPDTVTMLEKIVSLTPQRTGEPKNEHRTQIVIWNEELAAFASMEALRKGLKLCMNTL